MEFLNQYQSPGKSPDPLSSICCIPSTSAGFVAAAGGKAIHLLSNERLSSVSVLSCDRIVRSVAANSGDPNMLWSAGDDYVVRGWDVRTPKEPVRTLSTKSAIGPLCCVASSGETSRIAAGSEAIKLEGEDAASVLLWDARGGQPVADYNEAHSDTITTLCFSPANPQILCSGSLDGLVCITDTTSEDVDDALESVLNAESSVSQAGFFGPSSEYAYCVSLTETVLYWYIEDASRLGHHTDFRETVKKNCDITCDYIVDCSYESSDAGRLTALAGSHSGNLHLLNVSMDGLSLGSTLPKNHSTTVRCMEIDNTNDIMYTGDENGKVCCWSTRPSSSASASAAPSESTAADATPSSELPAKSRDTEAAGSLGKARRQHKPGKKYRPY